MGPLKKWPAGHLIVALSSGPSVESMRYLHSTYAGSPHLTLPPASRYAGQSRNVTSPFISSPPTAEGCLGLSGPPCLRSVKSARVRTG